jgi:hypothetical protein
MHVFTRKMRDATGKVATHRTNSNTPSKATGHIEPPALPHPDEILTVRWSGYFIPSSSTRPIAEIAAYYAAHPDSEGHPVSGDECARVRYSQCGDPDPDPTHRLPRRGALPGRAPRGRRRLDLRAHRPLPRHRPRRLPRRHRPGPGRGRARTGPRGPCAASPARAARRRLRLWSPRGARSPPEETKQWEHD